MKAARDPIEEAFSTPGVIEAALQEAVRDALLVHKRLGNPIAEWRNGRAVWISPEEIDVDQPRRLAGRRPPRPGRARK